MPAPSGLHLHHGNRLERLARTLADRLCREPLDPLAPETILVPHPGMAQWLKMQLAERIGVSAHLQLALPAAWLGRLAATGVSAREAGLWTRDVLAWRLYALHGSGLGPLERPASGATETLARWQLAEQLARLLERYQLYRPDWVRRWLDDEPVDLGPGSEHERWQRRLWQRLAEDAGSGGRRALVQRLAASVPEGARLPERLSVFGFASLPLLFQQRLRLLAERLPVHLYVANPCRHYWGDLLAERDQLRPGRQLQAPAGHDPDAEGHPLLAAFGGPGRDFLHQLYSSDLEFAEETEDFDPADGDSALASLQNQILSLAPAPLAWSRHDRSLRLLAAPTRRREVEALHDVLLGLLDQAGPAVQPHEVAVLVPRLSDYAPLVEAVFGSQPANRRIPWQLTDVSDSDRHPLPGVFLGLLDLPVSRFGLGEVLDLVARPAFASAFAIAGEELPRLASLLEQAGARWGLDGEFRRALAAGGEDAFSFRFALDRLLTGWAVGERDAGNASPASGYGGPGERDGVEAMVDGDAPGPLPFTALGGADADLVGRFVRCLDRLDHWRRRLAPDRGLADWAEQLQELAQDCLAETGNSEEDAALARLGQALAGWREQIDGIMSVPVPRRVLREALANHLQANAVSALPGEGVNICAMVPLRGLPFRVIALLGLSEGEFPRREPEQAFDLTRLRPRRGDRSVVAEDRYLVLEALLSARSVLLLSHVDRDPELGLVRPPAPVLAELRDHLMASALANEPSPQRALAARIEQVAPTPDDLRHFGADPAYVPSHAGEWRADPPVAVAPVALDPDVPDSWSEFTRLFLDPASTQMRWRGVDLGRGDAPVEDCEPFALDGLGAWQVREMALRTLARDPGSSSSAVLARLRGDVLLPPGAAGERAFATAWTEARRIHLGWCAQLDGRQPARFNGEMDVVAGRRMTVRIDDADELGLVRLSAGRVEGKRQLAAWLDLLALAVARGGTGLTATLVGLDGLLQLRGPDDPRAELERLADIWRHARRQPVPLYPRASAAYAESVLCGKGSDPATAMRKAAVVWQGGADAQQGRTDKHVRCERDDPAAAELARCFPHWAAHPFAELALAVHGPCLRARLS